MGEEIRAIIIFFGVAVGSAALAHYFIRQYTLGSFAGALTAAIVFQVWSYIELGYMDPFWPIAFVVSGLLSLFVALLVGGIFTYVRKKNRKVSGNAI